MTRIASVIVPAHDEAGCIGDCLSALLASGRLPAGWTAEVIVVANGCRDDTASIARGFAAAAETRGWTLRVIEEPRGDKPGALNLGDRAARGTMRVYLDADVRVSPDLLPQLVAALDTGSPRLAGGRPEIPRPRGAMTRTYARFWQRLPFFNDPVPGFGVFAMNAAGRARWGDWPGIISDDTFARRHFAPSERIHVDAGYLWPMVEGFANLVRVRRRQDAGVAEISTRFPELNGNAMDIRLSRRGLAAMALRDPAGFAAYAAVALAVRSPLFGGGGTWARGR